MNKCIQINKYLPQLGQGVLAKVPSSLVVQDKQRMRDLPCGVLLILSANGYVFVSPPRSDREVAVTSYSHSEEEVSAADPVCQWLRLRIVPVNSPPAHSTPQRWLKVTVR